MTNCCAVEYATAVSAGTLQQVSRARAFVAWVMPTAPGVNDTVLASEPDPVTHMIDSNVTGIAKAARKIPITASLQSQDSSDGRNTRVRYSFGRERITPPCFAFSQSFFSCRQKMRPRITISKTAPAAIAIETPGWSERFPNSASNEPGTDRKR